jgi:hypothetical protein
MQAQLSLSPVFVGLAVIFFGVAVRDYLKSEGKLTPARKTCLRVAFIFAGVGIVVYSSICVGVECCCEP